MPLLVSRRPDVTCVTFSLHNTFKKLTSVREAMYSGLSLNALVSSHSEDIHFSSFVREG
jgi:hypothetical protein